MKFCLSCRQQEEYLKKADEIKFYYRDRKAIPDFIEKYPSAAIILVHSSLDEEINWNEIKNYSVLARGNFIFCVDTIEDLRLAKEHELKYYHKTIVKTAYELNALMLLDVCYILVDAPLFFDTEYLKRVDIPIRAIPNVSQKDGLPRLTGISGSWIRPEDLSLYEGIITTIEFEELIEDRVRYLKRERALFRIYAEQHHWPGSLNLLIEDIQYDTLNRVIPSDVTKARLTCKQKCEQGGACRLCFHALTAANREKLVAYQQLKKEN